MHKKDLHEIHYMAWKKGVKSLYYCRSKSIQRAESDASWKRQKAGEAAGGDEQAGGNAGNYEECLACQ